MGSAHHGIRSARRQTARAGARRSGHGRRVGCGAGPFNASSVEWQFGAAEWRWTGEQARVPVTPPSPPAADRRPPPWSPGAAPANSATCPAGLSRGGGTCRRAGLRRSRSPDRVPRPSTLISGRSAPTRSPPAPTRPPPPLPFPRSARRAASVPMRPAPTPHARGPAASRRHPLDERRPVQPLARQERLLRRGRGDAVPGQTSWEMGRHSRFSIPLSTRRRTVRAKPKE
jgi:hypothetical protein